jgi:ergothioneine biosynthesis protein EgtB
MKLLEKYQLTRAASEQMCAPLEIEDYVPQPAEFVSPPKWNLGHTTWFFEEIILKKYLKGYTEFTEGFAFLFNSYYQALGDRVQRAHRGDLSRPVVSAIYKYRSYVDEQMKQLLTSDKLPEVADLVEIGINHEQQHQELFYSDLKYTFSLNPMYPAYSNEAYCEQGSSGGDSYIRVDEGLYEVGYSGNQFHYDNEAPRHKVFLPAFEIAKKLISNEEYLQFIDAGGYENPEFWHDDAWSWITSNHITHPMYWKFKDGVWQQYTLAGLRTLKQDSPVTHISFYEAYAYARFRGRRLPTEFEWEVASEFFKWGDRWEWTESAYLPYPGFKKLEGALGEYNGKFMVNQKVLRGASVVTPKGHERKTYRNFFHPNRGYQFNGIRLAK